MDLFEFTDGRVFLRLLLVRVPCVLFALGFHEWAHAWVSVWNGDDTPKLLGRYTLNPIKHIDPIGFGLFMVFGFGWSRPFPLHVVKFKQRKRRFFMTVVAGPFMNLLLAFVVGLIFYGLRINRFSFFFNPSAIEGNFLVMYLADVLGTFMLINLTIFFINWIPIPPLDASRILMIFSTSRYMKWVMKFQIYGLLTLLVLVLTGLMKEFMDPVLLFFQNLIMQLSQVFR